MNSSKPILGIDPDTRRLACAIAQRGRLLKVFTIGRTDYRGRMLYAYPHDLRRLAAWAAKHGARVVAEDCFLRPAGNRASNVKAYRALCSVQAELGLVCFDEAVPVERVAPVRWMADVLGVTRDRAAIKAASLEHARRWAAESGIPAPTSEHEADAAGVCAWALQAGQREANAAPLEADVTRNPKTPQRAACAAEG